MAAVILLIGIIYHSVSGGNNPRKVVEITKIL